MIVNEKVGDVMATDNQKALKRKETLKAISEMCLLDDNLMTLVFDRNIKAAKLLLNIILPRTDEDRKEMEERALQMQGAAE